MTASEPSRPPLDRAAVADVSGDWRVEVIERTASTNSDLADRARAGEPAGLVLVAEHQTAGRGRLDRSWVTPPRAALTFSALLRPAAEPALWPWLPLLAGLATARGIRRTSDLAGVTLKWPNDVLVGARKVAGILLERVDTAEGAAAIVGIGVNVATTAEELPVPSATSLALAGAEVDRGELLGAVLTELPPLLAEWELETDALRTAYVADCGTLGQHVQVTLPTGDLLLGRAVGIDLEGRLEVTSDTGTTAVGAGDVVHVR